MNDGIVEEHKKLMIRAARWVCPSEGCRGGQRLDGSVKLNHHHHHQLHPHHDHRLPPSHHDYQRRSDCYYQEASRLASHHTILRGSQLCPSITENSCFDILGRNILLSWICAYLIWFWFRSTSPGLTRKVSTLICQQKTPIWRKSEVLFDLTVWGKISKILFFPDPQSGHWAKSPPQRIIKPGALLHCKLLSPFLSILVFSPYWLQIITWAAEMFTTEWTARRKEF